MAIPETPARRRVRLPGVSSRAYEHPADRPALVALRAVPGFDSALRALAGAFRERSLRLVFLASAVRVDGRQFAGLSAIVDEAAQVLDLQTVPEVFVRMDPVPSATTLGIDRPFVVLSTGLLDLLDDEELRFAVGHELGHVLSGHALYRTMLHHLTRLSLRVAWVPIGALGLRAVVAALEEWQRKSELSGDRAGLLAGQDEDAALRCQMKMAGGARLADMDASAFLEQAAEYDATGDARDGLLKLLNLEGQTHPFAVTRAADLRRWAQSGEYARIVAGDYPRRADDPATSFTDEVKAAAASYRESWDASNDPFVSTVRDVGAQVGSTAGAAASWLGDRVRGRGRA